MSVRILVTMLVTLAVAWGACGPGAGEVGRERASSAAPGREQPRVSKVLTVAIQGEPDTFLTSGPGGGSGGENNVLPMIQDHLVVQDDKGLWQPELAAEQISLENGTWRVNPDGTMDVIWKLRPNVRWHDGAPFTAEDMVLTFDTYVDPASSVPGSVRPYLIGASAPDPLTFVVHWSTVRADANQAGIAITSPIPRHLVGDLFARGDRVAFENSRQFTTEFVGLGPYRLVKWERGSHMELARFDDYYRGRPPLDAITIRFMHDPNTMVSNILAGAVDVVLPVGVDLDAAVEVRGRWEGTGHQVKFDVSSRLPHLELQHRTDYAIPRNGLTLPLVRQALYQAIDRKTLAEVTTHGLAPVAESWILPTDAIYPEVEASIPRFPYDPERVVRLLAEAGWVRPSQGVPSTGSGPGLVHQESGEPFRTELWGSPGEAVAPEKALSVIARYWHEVGVQADLNLVATARLNDREYRVLHPGPFLATQASQRLAINGLHSGQIPTANNRWSGFNRGGYSNPRVDAVLDRLNTTIPTSERIPLHRQLLREQMGDVALMPLYWEVVPTLMVKGVRGPIFYRQNASWNIFQWNRE